MKRRGRGRRNKFGAKRTEVNGILFHSKKEAARYAELKLLEMAGSIEDLELQVSFDIKVLGNKICRYISDFLYYDNDIEAVVIEDVKGVQTDVFKLKWKLMKVLYPEFTYRIT